MNPPIISQETFDRAADARMTAKKKRGINTKPVIYGYTADPEDPDRLMIDEEAAASIRHIFDLKASGKSIREIDARAKYAINIIGIASKGDLNIMPSPDDRFKEGDHVRLISDKEAAERLFKELDRTEC